MTHLEALLERAADVQPIRFDAGDVRRRVQRRRRWRRSAAATAGILVIVGAVALTRVGADAPDRVHVLGEPDAVSSLVGRWTPVAFSGVTVNPAGAYLDFRSDGTLGGFDGCNDFGGHWRLEASRLVVESLASDGEDCPSVDPSLVRVLEEGPTVGPANDAPGTMELSSASGFITFRPAIGPDALTDTELMADVEGGGVVKVTFRTPRTIDAGAQRVLASWTSVTSSDQLVSVWADVAIEGLPADCQLSSVHRWEDLADDMATGSWDSYPRWNLRPGEGASSASTRRDVPAACAGEYTMVLLASTDFVADHVVSARVPITIR